MFYFYVETREFRIKCLEVGITMTTHIEVVVCHSRRASRCVVVVGDGNGGIRIRFRTILTDITKKVFQLEGNLSFPHTHSVAYFECQAASILTTI